MLQAAPVSQQHHGSASSSAFAPGIAPAQDHSSREYFALGIHYWHAAPFDNLGRERIPVSGELASFDELAKVLYCAPRLVSSNSSRQVRISMAYLPLFTLFALRDFCCGSFSFNFGTRWDQCIEESFARCTYIFVLSIPVIEPCHLCIHGNSESR